VVKNPKTENNIEVMPFEHLPDSLLLPPKKDETKTRKSKNTKKTMKIFVISCFRVHAAQALALRVRK